MWRPLMAWLGRGLLPGRARAPGGARGTPAPDGGRLSTGQSGAAAERFAEKQLKRRGWKLVARDVADRNGQLDLVVRDPAFDGLVVVEVRSHKPGRSHAEVIPESKQRQVVRTARRLLTVRKLRVQAAEGVRFDVALVELDGDGKPRRLDLISNAFTSDRRDWF